MTAKKEKESLGRKIMLLEKRHYLFRNWPKQSSKAILFPGCSFPSQFPATMRKLAEIAAEHGVAVAYDCCGKPLDDTGHKEDAERIASEIKALAEERGAERLIVLCPNCLDFFGKYLDFPVQNIYEALAEWGIVSKDDAWQGKYFVPCPDRKNQALYRAACQVCPMQELEQIIKAPCCGLRADFSSRPELPKKFCADIKAELGDEILYTYCASCSGQFKRHECGEIRHALSELLELREVPDASKSFINRVKSKFIKDLPLKSEKTENKS